MNLISGSALALAIAAMLGTTADAPKPPRPRAAGVSPTAHGSVAPRPGPTLAANAKPVPKPPPPRLKLEIISPRWDPLLPYGVEFASGWPLVLRVAGPNDALGIAMDSRPYAFPGVRQTGYLVLADPDNCLELPSPFFRDPTSPCASTPTDETYAEFTNDVDQAGIADNAGNAARLLALADPVASGGPMFAADGDSNNDQVLDPVDVVVGPDTGDATSDGVGFGADDDFPGLVLLSATGPGLVLNSDFTRPAVRRQRNLAGFLNTVAYELNAPGDVTTFSLSMVVPLGLVAPVMKIDDCVGTFDAGRGLCDGAPRYQLDGGPVLVADGNTNAQALYPQILFATPYFELRAFMVSGTAPSALSDLNGDGQVTAGDATLAGYRVISNEQVVRVREYSTDICTGVPLLNVFYADLDQNGRDTSIFVCPAGPGQITKPPK